MDSYLAGIGLAKRYNTDVGLVHCINKNVHSAIDLAQRLDPLLTIVQAFIDRPKVVTPLELEHSLESDTVLSKVGSCLCRVPFKFQRPPLPGNQLETNMPKGANRLDTTLGGVWLNLR